MARVDVVICSHPAANCELYLDFGKPLVIYATTRLEFGRLDRFVEWRKPFITDSSLGRWQAWVATVKRLASQPWNAVLANNWYDAHYIKYHTGVMPLVLPSWCGDHAHAEYRPEGVEILIVPYRDNLDFPKFRSQETWQHPVLAGMLREMGVAFGTEAAWPFTFARLRDRHPRYTFDQVAKHPAVLYIPYQASVMSFFELYRTSVPIFAPSHALLCEWQRDHGLAWERVYGDPPRQDFSWDFRFNPNSERTDDACAWLAFSDQYHTPHVILFNSWQHFVGLLRTTDLLAVSRRMTHHSKGLYANLSFTWHHLLYSIVAANGDRQRSLNATAQYSSAQSSHMELDKTIPPRMRVGMICACCLLAVVFACMAWITRLWWPHKATLRRCAVVSDGFFRGWCCRRARRW